MPYALTEGFVMNRISRDKLALALSLLLWTGNWSANALTKGGSEPIKHDVSADAGTESQGDEEKKTALANLDAGLKAYKDDPAAKTWQPVWDSIKTLVTCAVSRHSDPFVLVKANHDLVDLGLHLTDTGSVKTLSFPKTAECKECLVVWQESGFARVLPATGKGRARRAPLPPPSVLKVQAVALAPSTNLLDARLIATTAPGAAPVSIRVAGKWAGRLAFKAPVRSITGKVLVFLGSDRKTGSAYLGGYKLVDGRFVTDSNLLSGVPPFLLQCMQGKIAFNGTGVVLTADAPRVPAGSTDTAATGTGGYKISLIFAGDHYVLDSKSGVDPQTTVAMQFLRAIQSGRADLVKAWLVDPKLASIPGYIGLYSRGDNSALKLVPMAPPPTGNARFRLVTYAKDDLILDIGKVKQQWAVKALFIAPPDPLAKKLAGTMQSEDKSSDKSPD
jgi:hypothetical protein